MRFINILTVAVFGFASAAMALPNTKEEDAHKKNHKETDNDEECKCLKKKDVKELTEAYQRLIGNYKAEDLKYLSDDFEHWSQSINTLARASEPYDGVTFPSKEAFGASQSVQPGSPVVIQGEPVVDCKRFSFIWTSQFGKQRNVRGITIIDTTKKTGKWQISRIDVEFNSLSWAYNLNGYYCVFGRNAGNSSSCGAPTVAATVDRRSLPFYA